MEYVSPLIYIFVTHWTYQRSTGWL